MAVSVMTAHRKYLQNCCLEDLKYSINSFGSILSLFGVKKNPHILECSSNPYCVKPKTIKLVFVASPLSKRRMNKDWLAWNQNNVSKWGDMSIYRLLFQ